MALRFCLSLVLSALMFSTSVALQQTGAADQPYDVVENWMKPLEVGTLIHATSVFAESPDRVFVVLAGVTPMANAPDDQGPLNIKVPGAKVAHQISVVNRNGEVVERWTQWEKRFGAVHKVTISPYDPQKHVWVVDRGSQQVLKLTHDGKRVVMALGTENVPGKDERHFSQPSDIAFLPDGTFFVSDGDTTVAPGTTLKFTNTRVVKFDKDGRYLMAWDSGSPGQAVHGIAVDAQRRVYVAQRGNAAAGTRAPEQLVLVFDENGKELNRWKVDDVQRTWVTNDGFLWTGTEGGLAKYDLKGNRLTTIKTPGDFGNTAMLGPRFTKPSDYGTPHDWAVDCEGNLYVQGNNKHVTHKLVPKRNADRSRLVGSRLGDCSGRR